MFIYLQIATNLLMPLAAAILYMGCFLFAHIQGRGHLRYFNLFLVSFALYLLLRPLQLSLGPHPLPLWVCNFRFLLLNAICAPLAFLALCSFSHKPDKNSLIKAFTGGTLLGIFYCIMNSLGTTASYLILDLGPLLFHDNLTPAWQAPYYGREMTTICQCTVSTFFFIIPSLSCLRNKSEQNSRQNLFAIGLLLFGCAYLLGTLSHLWGIYYFAAAISALLLSKAAFDEIQQNRQSINQASLLIRDELMDAFLTSNGNQKKLKKLFRFIGCNELPDHFMILQCENSSNTFHKRCNTYIEKRQDQSQFHTFRLSQDRVGLACQNLQGQQLAEFAEDLRQEFSSERISVGISATLGDLCEAYREALLAVNRALALGGHIVVIYSSTEKLAAGKDHPQIQQGDLIKNIFELRSEVLDEKADLYVESLIKSCKMNLLNIKLRLQAIPSLLTASCLDKNINPEETLRCDNQQTSQLLELSNIDELRDWLKKTALLYLELIKDSRQKPEHAQIKRVKEYVETHYDEEITVDKAASIACLSASHFRRVFKQECGESFSQYLTAQRIAQAKLLLNDSQRPITEIAFELGFKDSNYFSTVFRKSEGTSPRDYRQNQN
jgi:AraC-like DNA-binding protein